MRNVIYIGGITASGKTTVAAQLGQHLGLPVYQTDAAYSTIAKWLNYPQAEHLVVPWKWKEFPKFGALKHDAYRALLGEERGDFIIEGFCLYFEQDRQLISQVTGSSWPTYFQLKPPVGKWLEMAEKKFGKTHSYKDYDQLQKHFEPPAHYYEISDPQVLFAHHEPYQRTGFTDDKWERLQLGDLTGQTVLDLGCNAGWIGRYCLDAGAKQVVGIDCNWRYLEEARQRGLETKLLRLERLSEVEGQFDKVLCLATFHYLTDKEAFIKECARLCRQELILEVPVLQEPGLKLGPKNHYYIPTPELVLQWLHKYFAQAQVIGESPAPDDSHRLIFKARP